MKGSGLGGLALVAFVSLGLPDGVLGVAWPSVRRTFGLPVSQLGSILFAVMAGYSPPASAAGRWWPATGWGRCWC